MTRRSFALPLLAVVAILSFVLAACNSTPPAPALTDPKEIITKGVTSLKDVKSFAFTGTFSGNVTVPQLGAIDLSTVKMAGSVDVTNQKAKFSLDAPPLLGTKVDALVVGNVAYYKVAGLLAAMLPGTAAGKYTKADVPTASGDPSASVADVAKVTAELQAALDKLPTAPTKGADEKCGDQDCYHVTMKLSGTDLGTTLGPAASVNGDLNVDLWTRKSDYRPAKIAFAATSPDIGSFGMTLELQYDVSVDVSAPPADQIAP